MGTVGMGTERVQYTVLQATLCKEQWLSLPRVNVANILERRGHLARQLHAGMLCHYSQRFSQRPKLRPFPNSSMLCARCHGYPSFTTQSTVTAEPCGALKVPALPLPLPPSPPPAPPPSPQPSTAGACHCQIPRLICCLNCQLRARQLRGDRLQHLPFEQEMGGS